MIQEIALSRNSVIVCGEKRFPWSVLPAFFHDHKIRDAPPLLSLGKRGLRDPTELADLLRVARLCQATDPRDRVFALLGLVLGAEAEGLVADYTQSIPDVFTWITKYLVRTATAADVLGNVSIHMPGPGPESLLARQLPSWVPDWTDARRSFLERFPTARTYLEDVHLELDTSDTRALRLAGAIVGCREHKSTSLVSGFMLRIRGGPPGLLQRLVYFRAVLKSPKTPFFPGSKLGPRFLVVLEPVGREHHPAATSFTPELPSCWARDADAFRFRGLLAKGELVSPYLPHGNESPGCGHTDSVSSVKLV